MLFYLHLAVSFVIGGLFVALQTLIAERVSGLLRGIILTIPASMAISLFFIGLTKSAHDVTEVVKIIPAALASDYLFVLIFALFSRYGLALAVTSGFAAFFASAYLIILFPPQNYATSILLYCAPIIIISYLIIKKMPQASALKPYPLTATHIFLRSLMAGIIVMGTVFLAKTLGNTWGGIFSSFPATFSATLIIYYYSQGKEVIPSVGKSMFFPGVVGFVLYALVAGAAFSEFGIWWGTLAAYATTFGFYGLYYWLHKKNI